MCYLQRAAPLVAHPPPSGRIRPNRVDPWQSVSWSVILELEWVMRGFYEVEPASFCDAMTHLLGMGHVTVERWEAVSDAVNLHRRGLDFADALHLTTSAACSQFLSFDERRFVRRARRLKLTPEMTIPK